MSQPHSQSISAHTLTDAFHVLNDLAKEEYGSDLEFILKDNSRGLEDRLWRIGRLAAVEVKRPFAKAVDDSDMPEGWKSMTGARRAWILKQNEPSAAHPDLWQYRLLESFVQDPSSVQGHYMLDFYSPIVSNPQKVAFALDQMQSERGLWRCLTMSARRYLCGDEQLKAALNEVGERSGRPSGSLTPQSLVAAGSVETANLISDSVPWLDGSGSVVAAAFVLIISTVGLDGFCEWSGQFVDEKAFKELPSDG
jgi:hypothetical protein